VIPRAASPTAGAPAPARVRTRHRAGPGIALAPEPAGPALKNKNRRAGGRATAPARSLCECTPTICTSLAASPPEIPSRSPVEDRCRARHCRGDRLGRRPRPPTGESPRSCVSGCWSRPGPGGTPASPPTRFASAALLVLVVRDLEALRMLSRECRRGPRQRQRNLDASITREDDASSPTSRRRLARISIRVSMPRSTRSIPLRPCCAARGRRRASTGCLRFHGFHRATAGAGCRPARGGGWRATQRRAARRLRLSKPADQRDSA